MNARRLFYFKTLIYWSTRATGPITIRRVMSAFLTASKGLFGLSFWLPSVLNLQHSVVLWVVNGPSTALHHLQNLLVRPFLGVPFLGPPPCDYFPFLGTCSPANLAVAATLALLLARATLFAFSANSFSIFSRSPRMALGDLGTNACVSAYDG